MSQKPSVFDQATKGLSPETKAHLFNAMTEMGLHTDEPFTVGLGVAGWIKAVGERVPASIRAAGQASATSIRKSCEQAASSIAAELSRADTAMREISTSLERTQQMIERRTAVPTEIVRLSESHQAWRRKAIAVAGGVAFAALVLGFVAGVAINSGIGGNEAAALHWADSNDMRAWLNHCSKTVQAGRECQVRLIVP